MDLSTAFDKKGLKLKERTGCYRCDLKSKLLADYQRTS